MRVNVGGNILLAIVSGITIMAAIGSGIPGLGPWNIFGIYLGSLLLSLLLLPFITSVMTGKFPKGSGYWLSVAGICMGTAAFMNLFLGASFIDKVGVGFIYQLAGAILLAALAQKLIFNLNDMICDGSSQSTAIKMLASTLALGAAGIGGIQIFAMVMGKSSFVELFAYDNTILSAGVTCVSVILACLVIYFLWGVLTDISNPGTDSAGGTPESYGRPSLLEEMIKEFPTAESRHPTSYAREQTPE